MMNITCHTLICTSIKKTPHQSEIPNRTDPFFGHHVSEDAKHRTSLSKSTDVLHRKYGCLHQSDVFDFRKRTVSKGYRPEDFYRFTSSATDGRSAESVTLQPSQSMPGMGGTSLRTLTLAARTTGKATRMPWSRRPQRCSSN